MIHLLAQSDKLSTETFVFAALWVITTGGFIATVALHLNRKRFKFPLIDGGRIEISGPRSDQEPTYQQCFDYLAKVLERLDSTQPAKEKTQGARRIQLPNGTLLTIQPPDGTAPSFVEFRHYLRVAEQMVDMMESQATDKPRRPIEDDLPESFRVPAGPANSQNAAPRPTVQNGSTAN